MRILITGAGGMLGSDVSAAAIAAGHEPAALARDACDITDLGSVRAAIERTRPDAVVNCAAWTDVDGAESEREAAYAVNVTGAGNVATAAAEADAFVVHVSTDYVFAGTKRAPYVESDPTGPRSVYGETKLAGEHAVAEAAPDAHAVVRSSWLFGAHGNCFPKTMLRLAAERDSINVVDDQRGAPTFTGHLAPALVELSDGRLTGVLHAGALGECSWYGFARSVVGASGYRCAVRPIPSSDYPTPATRPAYSLLRSERGAPVLPSWQQGLEAFLSEAAEMRSA